MQRTAGRIRHHGRCGSNQEFVAIGVLGMRTSTTVVMARKRMPLPGHHPMDVPVEISFTRQFRVSVIFVKVPLQRRRSCTHRLSGHFVSVHQWQRCIPSRQNQAQPEQTATHPRNCGGEWQAASAGHCGHVENPAKEVSRRSRIPLMVPANPPQSIRIGHQAVFSQARRE